MKHRLSEYMDNHKRWIENFLCNFFATMLGIALTFGTTWWIERCQIVDAAEESVKRCLANRERRSDDLGKNIRTMLRQETFRRILIDVRFSGTHTDREKVELMLGLPEVPYFILQHNGWANVLKRSVTEYRKQILPFLHKLWRGEITETEVDFTNYDIE